MNDAEFLVSLGFNSVKLEDGPTVLIDQRLGNGFMFVKRFDSALGVDLFDFRAVVLMNLPTKAPEFLALVESLGTFSLGQWTFAGDDTQGYNLSYGIQVSPQVLTNEVVSASVDFLREVQLTGRWLLEMIESRPAIFENVSGISWVAPSGSHEE